METLYVLLNELKKFLKEHRPAFRQHYFSKLCISYLFIIAAPYCHKYVCMELRLPMVLVYDLYCIPSRHW